jgi:hypothetical protein
MTEFTDEQEDAPPDKRLKYTPMKSFCRDCDGDSKEMTERQMNVVVDSRQPGRMYRCYACACRRWIHMLGRRGKTMVVGRSGGLEPRKRAPRAKLINGEWLQ